MTQTSFAVPFPKQWILPDGSPSVAFYKFIVNLFGSSSGGGVPPGTLQGNITGGTSPAIPNTLSAILDALISNSSGDILIRGGAVWQGEALSTILDSAIGNVRGDIALRGAATWSALTIGTTGKALVSDGTDLAYALVASLASTVTLAAAAPATITTAGGDLLLDSATHQLQLGTTAAAATVSAAFLADHRIQIKDGAGNTYYVAVSNVAW